MVLTLGDTFADLYNSIHEPNSPFRGFNYIHFDLRSINNNLDNSIASFDVDVTDGSNIARVATTDLQGSFDVSGATGNSLFGMNPASLFKLFSHLRQALLM